MFAKMAPEMPKKQGRLDGFIAPLVGGLLKL